MQLWGGVPGIYSHRPLTDGREKMYLLHRVFDIFLLSFDGFRNGGRGLIAWHPPGSSDGCISGPEFSFTVESIAIISKLFPYFFFFKQRAENDPGSCGCKTVIHSDPRPSFLQLSVTKAAETAMIFSAFSRFISLYQSQDLNRLKVVSHVFSPSTESIDPAPCCNKAPLYSWTVKTSFCCVTWWQRLFELQ